MHRRRPGRSCVVLATLCALVTLATACAQAIPGTPTAAEAPSVGAPSPVPVPPGDVDALAVRTADALQDFWRTEFPAAFGQPWRDIAELVPVHTDDPRAEVPSCLHDASDVKQNALYCSESDAVAWDADGLVPQLNEKFGAAGVVVVLAHEIGHAVQARLGVERKRAADPNSYPTILLEAMSDCYAGVAMQHFAQEPLVGLRVGPTERDAALLSLVGFSDPVGTSATGRDAHGNAFDRVSSFQDGYLNGPSTCAGMTLTNRTFTQRRFASADDAARHGDLPMTELVRDLQADARPWFASLVTSGWSAPTITTAPSGACPTEQLRPQGPVSFCTADSSISIDQAQLAPVHRQIGDFADGALIASRYALAVRQAAGEDVVGPAAGDGALCLAGAYTARLFGNAGTFGLSPGDLDEAVQVLLVHDWAARDADGGVDPNEHGFDRVAHFRVGVVQGATACAR